MCGIDSLRRSIMKLRKKLRNSFVTVIRNHKEIMYSQGSQSTIVDFANLGALLQSTRTFLI